MDTWQVGYSLGIGFIVIWYCLFRFIFSICGFTQQKLRIVKGKFQGRLWCYPVLGC